MLVMMTEENMHDNENEDDDTLQSPGQSQGTRCGEAVGPKEDCDVGQKGCHRNSMLFSLFCPELVDMLEFCA